MKVATALFINVETRPCFCPFIAPCPCMLITLELEIALSQIGVKREEHTFVLSNK